MKITITLEAPSIMQMAGELEDDIVVDLTPENESALRKAVLDRMFGAIGKMYFYLPPFTQGYIEPSTILVKVEK